MKLILTLLPSATRNQVRRLIVPAILCTLIILIPMHSLIAGEISRNKTMSIAIKKLLSETQLDFRIVHINRMVFSKNIDFRQIVITINVTDVGRSELADMPAIAEKLYHYNRRSSERKI